MTARLFALFVAGSLGAAATWLPGSTSSLAMSQHGSMPAHAARHVASRPVPVARAAQLKLAAGTRLRSPIFRGGATRAHAAATGSGLGQQAPSLRLKAGAAPVVYNGDNKAGMAAAASGGETPPDSTGAAGPSNYLEMDNSNFAAYDRTLKLQGVVTLDVFALQGPAVPFCDPQIQWDPSANRWLYSFLYCNTSTTQQVVEFGWSKTANPLPLTSGNWCQFAFDNTHFLFDYDKLGHSDGYLVVGGNLYDESHPTPTPPFVRAGMEWAPLPAAGDTSCSIPITGATSLPLRNGDTSLSFTPVPVNTDISSPNAYVVAAHDPAGNTNGIPAPQSNLTVWHLDAGGNLILDGDIGVTSTYTFPKPATQPGTPDTLDTLDGRLTQAEGNPVTGFYTQHTVGGSLGLSDVRWYELKVTAGTVSLVQQGAIGFLNTYTFNAAISPRTDGQGAAIFYDVSGAAVSKLPQVWTQVRRSSDPAGSFEPGITDLVNSTNADTDFSCTTAFGGPPCRWGDYSGATPDPAQPLLVWGTNMFTAIPSVGGQPQWSDENFAVEVPASQIAVVPSGTAAPSPRQPPVQSGPTTPGR